LSDLSDPRDDARDVAHEKGLPLAFSEAAEEEAAARAAAPITEAGRVDLRALPAVTIDPEEAADFDDAVSWRALPGGHDEVGVHIADVAWYVEPGGAVDQDAVERGTSAYLPGLVLPMLPAPLSSDAASLKPGLDRPALSVRAELDPEGKVVAWRLDRSLIRSRRRLTYAEAERLLAGHAAAGANGSPAAARGAGEDPAWLPALRRLGAITALLRERREARGGLYLDVPEYRVRMDELGHPLDLIPRRQGAAHRLVEELMLLANELTGGWARAAGLPILFRVHERPRWEKLMEFGLVLDELGLPRQGLDFADPAVLQGVIGMAAERGVGELASTYLLRSLEKARYDATDRGHFGLGVAGYTHFTSPIRRYPDLHTHRVLLAAVDALGDGGPRARRRSDQEDLLRPVRDRYRPGLEELALATSAREVVAADAERLVVRVKALRLLAPRLGEEMTGMVTATLPTGLFVTLDEIPVDGFVARERLPADRYDLGARGHSLAGRRTGTRFALGQRVRVRIDRLSMLDRELELSIVGGALAAAPGETRR
jgi:ribonuclease R